MKRQMGFLSVGLAAFVALMTVLAPGAMAGRNRGAGGGGGTTEGTTTNTTGAEVVSSVSKKIDGAKGGVVRLNNWKIDVPAGAYQGSATITISQLATDPPTVDLLIDDPSKNAFMRPVWLGYKYPNGTEAADKVIAWLNPATGTWIVLPGAWFEVDGWIRVPLWHFSKYRTSRAGW